MAARPLSSSAVGLKGPTVLFSLAPLRMGICAAVPQTCKASTYESCQHVGEAHHTLERVIHWEIQDATEICCSAMGRAAHQAGGGEGHEGQSNQDGGFTKLCSDWCARCKLSAGGGQERQLHMTNQVLLRSGNTKHAGP